MLRSITEFPSLVLGAFLGAVLGAFLGALLTVLATADSTQPVTPEALETAELPSYDDIVAQVMGKDCQSLEDRILKLADRSVITRLRYVLWDCKERHLNCEPEVEAAVRKLLTEMDCVKK